MGEEKTEEREKIVSAGCERRKKWYRIMSLSPSWDIFLKRATARATEALCAGEGSTDRSSEGAGEQVRPAAIVGCCGRCFGHEVLRKTKTNCCPRPIHTHPRSRGSKSTCSTPLRCCYFYCTLRSFYQVYSHLNQKIFFSGIPFKVAPYYNKNLFAVVEH